MIFLINALNVRPNGGAFNILVHLTQLYGQKGKVYVYLSRKHFDSKSLPVELEGKIIVKSKILAYFNFFLRHRHPETTLISLNSLPALTSCYQTVYYHFPLVVFGTKIIGKSEIKLWLAYYYHRLAEKILFSYFQGEVLVQSDYMQKTLKKNKIFKNWRISIDRPLLNRSFKKRARAPFQKENKLRIIYPATLFEYKNHKWIIEIFEKAKIQIELYSNIKKEDFVKRYGPTKFVENCYFFAKSAEEMVKTYSRCDALIFPSKAETLGLPLVEAMALGMPIIAIDYPHIKSVVGNYKKITWLSSKPAIAVKQLKNSSLYDKL